MTRGARTRRRVSRPRRRGQRSLAPSIVLPWPNCLPRWSGSRTPLAGAAFAFPTPGPSLVAALYRVHLLLNDTLAGKQVGGS